MNNGKYTVDNDYGCTRWTAVTDMTVEDNGTLLDQLDINGYDCQTRSLNMGSIGSVPCSLVHYVGKISKIPITVLIVPQSGIDSWCEDYYHFPGMTSLDAESLDWREVLIHLRRVIWETIRSKVPPAPYCRSCHTINSYDDIRGNKRCSQCHEIIVANRMMD